VHLLLLHLLMLLHLPLLLYLLLAAVPSSAAASS
jgi:hypothetical protein